MTKKPVLVLVHPGSACGSANDNLLKSVASAGRDGLVLDLNGATGDVLVIDGHFSDEIPNYRQYHEALENALQGARDRGDLAIRILGDDSEEFNQVAAAEQLIAEHGLLPDTHRITITGAWVDHDDDSGCVNSVMAVFQRHRFSATISDFAMSLDDGDDIEFDDEDEADEAATSPRI